MDPSRRQFEYMQLQINDAQATVDRQRELLERLEYVVMDDDGIPRCPECGYEKVTEGHWKDCELAEALDAATDAS
jgi:hypothetical protein